MQIFNLLAVGKILQQLVESGALLTAVWETIYLTLLSTFFAYVIGLPLGIVLVVTDVNGIKPNKIVNSILGFVVNILRSIPFIVLMVAMLPVSKFILGSSTGNGAMIVMLTIAAAPYIARMVESSIKEVDGGIIEASRSMGANTWQIITKVLIPESKPSLIVGAVICTVTVLGYSAMGSTIAAGGLGALAINFGHKRYQDDVIWVCVIIIVIIVQIIQEVGMCLARRFDRRVHSKKKGKKTKENNA